jgi:hypothetical protein
MSDSQTVTIPAVEHAATADTRPARLLKVLAQNPEPLSTPALASFLAEPGQRQRLLATYDRTLRQHEQAGRVPHRRGRPAIIWRITAAGRDWLSEHDKASALAAASATAAQRRTEQAQRTATERDQALGQARGTFSPETPRISRKRTAHKLRELGCTSIRSARSSTSAERESARTSSGIRWRVRPGRGLGAAGADHVQEDDQPDEQDSDYCWSHRAGPGGAGGQGVRCRLGHQEDGGKGRYAHDGPDGDNVRAWFRRGGACRGGVIERQVGEQGGQFFPGAAREACPDRWPNSSAVIRPTRKAPLSSASARSRSRSVSDTRRSPGGKPRPASSMMRTPSARSSARQSTGTSYPANASERTRPKSCP